MRKKWTILFLCAFMAVASFGGAAMLSMPQASAEEASDVVQLITEPVTSQGNANLDWRQAVTIPMGDRTINSGDVLTLTYTIDTERGPAMTVGGVSVYVHFHRFLRNADARTGKADAQCGHLCGSHGRTRKRILHDGQRDGQHQIGRNSCLQ